LIFSFFKFSSIISQSVDIRLRNWVSILFTLINISFSSGAIFIQLEWSTLKAWLNYELYLSHMGAASTPIPGMQFAGSSTDIPFTSVSLRSFLLQNFYSI
jgi:hypothetical protein